MGTANGWRKSRSVANSRRLVDSALERALGQQMPNEAKLRANEMEMIAQTSEEEERGDGEWFLFFLIGCVL